MTRLRIEDYALIGDCATAALVGRNGSIDWLCLPRFDLPACFSALLGEPEHGRWLIAPCAPDATVQRRYIDTSLVLATTFETAQGAVELIDLFGPWHGPLDLVRLVRGLRGRVKMQVEIVLRFDYGYLVPWVEQSPDGGISAIAGPERVVLRTPVKLTGEDLKTVGGVRGRRRRNRPLRADLWRLASAAAAAGGRRARPRQCARLLAAMEHRLRFRGAVDRHRQRLARGAEGPDLRADRRHRRRTDDLAPGAPRRPAQLGLPLLLAARRHLYPVGADACRLFGRGAVVARLVVSRGRRQPGSDPDHVRDRRRAPADRVGGAVAARVRRVAAGSHRQRRIERDPARHLRRNH